MEANEIPQEQRSLGNCKGCRTRHYCSWEIGGNYYCGDCKDKKMGVVEEAPSLTQADVDKVVQEVFEPAQSRFALNPVKTTVVAIGELETGWVLSYDGDSHVFTSKTKLIDKISKLISPPEKKKWPKEVKDVPGFEGTLESLAELGGSNEEG